MVAVSIKIVDNNKTTKCKMLTVSSVLIIWNAKSCIRKLESLPKIIDSHNQLLSQLIRLLLHPTTYVHMHNIPCCCRTRVPG